MAFQPVGYGAGLPGPNLGRQIEGFGEALVQRRKRKQAEELKQQFSVDLQNAYQTGSQQAFLDLMVKYPGQAQGMKPFLEQISSTEREAEFRTGAEISNALESGNLKVATERLNTALEARRNAGKPTKIYEDVLRAMEAGEVTTAQAGVNHALMLIDADRFKKIAEGRKTTRDMELATAKGRQDALKTGLEIDKLQKELDLAGLKEEDIRAGRVPPEKRVEIEDKHRTEWFRVTKPIREAKQAYGKIQAVSDTGPGDVSLIFQYMKLLDPGSVVRESEFSLAEDTGGIGDRFKGFVQRVENGQRLTPAMRKAFIDEARNLNEKLLMEEKVLFKDLNDIVVRRGLNPDNVFVGYEQDEAPPEAIATPGDSRDMGAPLVLEPGIEGLLNKYLPPQE